MVKQKHFTQSLVGGDIERLLEYHYQIVDDMSGILHDPTLRRNLNVKADIEERIDTFLMQLRGLLNVFQVVCALMNKTEQLSEFELNAFDALCVKFGKLWRVAFPGNSITPKLHLLESHAPLQMRMFGCMGDKEEGAVERLHHYCNKAYRTLSAIPDWEERQAAMRRRKAQAELFEVQTAEKITMEKSKRKFSPEVVAQRSAKKEELLQVKAYRIEEALNLGLNFEYEVV